MLKILFLSAEVTPIAKVGGLGDVAGALPKALADLGADIRLMLPYYGLIGPEYKTKLVIESLSVKISGREEDVSIWEAALPGSGVPIYLIKHKHFSGKAIYSSGAKMENSKYETDLNDIERFVFYSRASLAAAKALNFLPDIIHSNDWHVASAFNYLAEDPELKNSKKVFTIHNLANQGIIGPDILNFSGMDPDLENIKRDLENGDINFMVQGILGSTLINTVSPTYAKEILTAEYGAGLDNVLKKRKKDLYGVLNGIDVDFFNPETDNLIPHKYSIKTLEEKIKNKSALQKKLGLPQNENIPLVGFVSRFVWQKGVDLITENFSGLDCQFVFLGTGEAKYEEHLKALADKYPDKFSAQIRFDEGLAHEIYAASDMFLVPSRFEPCGLTQMIAMRYGAVPVVRKTGGLADTVNWRNGFVFKDFSADVLYKTLEKAIKKYRASSWKKLQIRGMKQDFSWKKSAKEYLKLYKKALKK